MKTEMIEKTEKTEQQRRENLIFDESLRLIHLSRQGGEDILGEALNGREKNVENVSKLWKLVALAFSAGMSLPAGRCQPGWDVYWNAVSEYLRSKGWSDQQLRELKNPAPYTGPSTLLDGLEGDANVENF